MGCNSCIHPSCMHSATFNGMCDCPSSSENGIVCNGMLVLDVNSKPNWKLACNRCNTLLRFHAEIFNITPQSSESCQECGLRISIFEFNKLKSPLADGETTYKGCIVCDDLLNSLTEIVMGKTMHFTISRQIRHKRGSGGRGRGRGRGLRNPKMSFSEF